MGQIPTKQDIVVNTDIEVFPIVWLDTQVNRDHNNLAAQKQLRELDKNLLTFDNEEKCHKHIVSTSAEDRIVFIVSGQQGRIIVPKIHQLPQIILICVYCMNATENKVWAKPFDKVKTVAEKFADIITCIKSVQQNITLGAATSTNSNINVYTHYCTAIDNPFDNPLSFLECFLRIKSNQSDITECIAYCRNKYKRNQHELDLIQEFQQSYTSERAIWWYTRQSFVFRILSNILRKEKSYLIYKFRFLLHDIYQQLKQCQCQSRIQVYRGQLLPDQDIIYFKTLIGKIVTIKSFFTTWSNRNHARSGLKPSTNDSKQVLFEIDAIPGAANCKPYGDISLHNSFPKPGEVLFMAASNFRIDTVHYGADQMWIIRMTLVVNDSPNWKDFLQRIDIMEKNVGGLNLASFGTIMRCMGHVSRAKSYCSRLFNQLSLSNPLAAVVCFELAEIASSEGDSDASKSWYEQGTHIKRKYGVHGDLNYEPKSTDSILSRSVDFIVTLRNSNESLDSMINEAMVSQRFTSGQLDKHQVRFPIEGYEKVPLVSLEEAMVPLLGVLPDIQRMVYIAKMKCELPTDGLTSDQSAAIMLYTMEWEPSETCLYFVLNSALRTADREIVKPWFLYLKLIFTALSLLPTKSGTFYRGVKLNLSSQHSQGETFYWWSFSSCTTTINVLTSDQFLGSTDIRTLFAIESTSGRDISRHSYYQNEREILLLPATRFQVVGHLPFTSNVHIIQLKEIESEFPLLNPIV
ncbi:unnamed protein product [Rotaria magnacalcarata]|uniref:NAD(P)(+)--arginine ADP-ribosyltransferase n=2 Tax=Rotaria magnacalcarata TaxID=392030 RepID=A0A816TIH7_9BILA|nr:unnamed protein product [Rotaria magnacalcarata]CAF4080833.1 unnamed protein product [Rotaria magnacalcarata]